MLDSSVLIRAERQRLPLGELLGEYGEQPVAMAGITVAELLVGAERTRDDAMRLYRYSYIETALDLIPVIPFGIIEARRHAAVHALLVSRGTPIGAHDTIIAATALAHGYAVMTTNAREFSRVPGLRVITL